MPELTVTAVPAFADNYIWLLSTGEKKCAVVDPGDADEAARLERMLDDEVAVASALAMSPALLAQSPMPGPARSARLSAMVLIDRILDCQRIKSHQHIALLDMRPVLNDPDHGVLTTHLGFDFDVGDHTTVNQFQNLTQFRQTFIRKIGMKPASGIQLLQFLKGMVMDRSVSVGCTFQGRIVDDHQLAIAA